VIDIAVLDPTGSDRLARRGLCTFLQITDLVIGVVKESQHVRTDHRLDRRPFRDDHKHFDACLGDPPQAVNVAATCVPDARSNRKQACPFSRSVNFQRRPAGSAQNLPDQEY